MKVLRRWMAMCLVCAVCWTASGQEVRSHSVEEQIRSAQPGSKIKAVLKSGETVEGRLGRSVPDGFTVESKKAPVTVRFEDIRSVKVGPKTHTPVGAWIAAGAIAAVVVIVVVVVLAERHNEGG